MKPRSGSTNGSAKGSLFLCFVLRHVTYGFVSVCSTTPDFFASQDFRTKDQFLYLGSVKDIFKCSLTLAAVFLRTFQREFMQPE